MESTIEKKSRLAQKGIIIGGILGFCVLAINILSLVAILN